MKNQEQANRDFTRKPERGTRNPQRREGGFTLVELGVCISVIAILAAVLLHRFVFYKEMAEKAAMESTVRIIKTGLQIRLAELIITNRQAQAAALETDDPTRWLDARPANFGGDYGVSPQRGTWYFDALERQLVYVVNTGDRLNTDSQADAKQLRFRVRLLKDRVHVPGAVVESVTGVTLLPLSQYRWQ